MTPRQQEWFKVIVGFGSLVLIPFLGILSLVKTRVFPYLLGFLIFWLLAGAMAITGGITPIEQGDFVTYEEQQTWLNSAFVKYTRTIWLTGLVIGAPLLAITWAFEHRLLSKGLKFLLSLIKIIAAAISFWAFLKLFVLSRF